MSIRKRARKTAKGEAKEAWVVDYVDQSKKRRLKTFEKKKEAIAFAASSAVEIKQGVHTPESESPTVSEAASAWLADCDGLERATLAQCRQHVKLHIEPYLGRVELAQLSTPMVCEFRDKLKLGEAAPGEAEGRARSPALIRKVMTSLGSLISHAKERGKFAGANPVRELGKSKRGVEKRGEKRAKGRLQVGRDIPAQTMLGRKSITMTADIYGHLFERGDDAAELAAAKRGLWARRDTNAIWLNIYLCKNNTISA